MEEKIKSVIQNDAKCKTVDTLRTRSFKTKYWNIFFTDRYNGLNGRGKGRFNQESQGACAGAVTNGISTVNGNNSSESQVLALPKNGTNNTNNM